MYSELENIFFYLAISEQSKAVLPKNETRHKSRFFAIEPRTNQFGSAFVKRRGPIIKYRRFDMAMTVLNISLFLKKIP
jgi:hypothetical protein